MQKSLMMLVAPGIILACLTARPAEAASFSCKKAATADEKAICRDQTLSQQDIDADAAYRLAVGKFGKSAVKTAARAFLNERGECGAERACISNVQQRMIAHYYDLLRNAALVKTGADNTIPYGTRAGMETTIVDSNGLGSERAMIQTEHTRENAKAFCREYVQTASESCIQETLRDVKADGTLIADCTTGEFSALGGTALTRRHDGTIFNRDTNEVLDGSMASGEPVYAAQYAALCPSG